MADRAVQLAFPSPPASNSSSTSSLPLHKKYMSMSCPPITNPVQLSDSQRRERWKAGLTLFGSFFTLLVSFGLLNSFGTFEHYYRGHQLQHIPQHNISWIGSLQLWVFSFAGSPIGHVYDRYGPRYLMLAGTLCYVVGLVTTSVSKEFYQFMLAQSILVGLGVGLLFYPCLSALSTHFDRYKSTALGIALAGSGLGGVMYPLALKALFSRVGFGWGVRVVALLSLVCCMVGVLTVTPKACIPASGSEASESTEKVEEPIIEKTSGGVWSRALKDQKFMLIIIGSIFISLGIYIPNFYIVNFAQDTLSSPGKFGSYDYVLTVMNAGSLIGRLLPAYLSDVFGRFNILYPSTLLTGVLTLTIWLVLSFHDWSNLCGVVTFAVLYGICSGAYIALLTPSIASISEVKEIGRRIGLVYTVLSFPALVGPPIAGALFSVAGYKGMIAFSGSVVTFGSFFILLARRSINSKVWTRV